MAACADDCERHTDEEFCNNLNESAWHVVLRKVAEPLDFECCDSCKVWYADNMPHKVVLIEQLNP
jgi:hypothetical protein